MTRPSGAKDLEDKVVDKVRRSYDQTVDDGSHVWDELGHLESDAKSLRDRVHDLENKDDVKSDAEHLHGDVDKLIESVDTLMEKVNRDKSTLDNVKDGVMSTVWVLFASLPTIVSVDGVAPFKAPWPTAVP
jgi:predicted nuclease with TOPRIM domain